MANGSFSFVKRIPWVKVVVLLFVLAAVAIFFLIRNGDETKNWVLGTVDEGTVSQIVSVSGTMDSTQTAALAFPVPGVLEQVLVAEGDVVMKGQELAVLAHDDLKADYQDAYATLAVAEADRDELVSGLRPEELSIAETNVLTARQNLERVKREQAERVQNAYNALLSSDLQAEPEDKEGSYTAPTITGTYTCESQGEYLLDVYRSDTKSGYSYILSGLEAGAGALYTDAPGPLGKCGLFIQFTENESYANSEWTIDIPNVSGSSYVTNVNAYNLALIQEENAVEAAEEALQLAEQTLALETATPRSEALARAEARVVSAQARLERVRAQIADHILTSPFGGTISSVGLNVGETVGTAPVITVVSDTSYELTALIPEIDITHVFVGQKAQVVFDAREGEVFDASIVFVSPLAKEIGGVSYFEAKLLLDSDAEWLRSGLNADIDIILEKREGATRIPRRFLIEENGGHTVLIPQGEKTRAVSVTVDFIGNDGFAAISGLDKGDTVVAP